MNNPSIVFFFFCYLLLESKERGWKIESPVYLIINDQCNFLTDLFMIISGFLGVMSMLILSLHKNLHLGFALLSLVAGSAGIAIADVAIDACVTQHAISHPYLAGDMQGLCGMSSSIGALLGFSLSGFFVHLVGAKVFFLPSILVVIDSGILGLMVFRIQYN